MSAFYPSGHIATKPMPVAEVSHDQHWYALQTRPRHEKKVALILRARQVETFLPLLPCRHQWSDRQKRVDLPLFAGYAFVRISPLSFDRLRVLQTPGVLFLVGAGSPCPSPRSRLKISGWLFATRCLAGPIPSCPLDGGCAFAVGAWTAWKESCWQRTPIAAF